ncbi:circadian clock KaiB family protein [Coleofasciculus chthonoplastes]|uniref:circadian clock KaiB family protein n=1 Tax=Coleofasciculus chthonoplastes TaxID=64178 RepID=UPI004064891E
MCEQYQLKLYVTGDTTRSQRAIANLYRLCDQELPGQYKITVIDVTKSPQLAEAKHILVTPTLIKEFPNPVQRIVGDLSDTETVLWGLNIGIRLNKIE